MARVDVDCPAPMRRPPLGDVPRDPWWRPGNGEVRGLVLASRPMHGFLLRAPRPAHEVGGALTAPELAFGQNPRLEGPVHGLLPADGLAHAGRRDRDFQAPTTRGTPRSLVSPPMIGAPIGFPAPAGARTGPRHPSSESSCSGPPRRTANPGLLRCVDSGDRPTPWRRGISRSMLTPNRWLTLGRQAAVGTARPSSPPPLSARRGARRGGRPGL